MKAPLKATIWSYDREHADRRTDYVVDPKDRSSSNNQHLTVELPSGDELDLEFDEDGRLVIRSRDGLQVDVRGHVTNVVSVGVVPR